MSKSLSYRFFLRRDSFFLSNFHYVFFVVKSFLESTSTYSRFLLFRVEDSRKPIFVKKTLYKERVPLVMMLRNLSFSFQFQENAGKYLNSAYRCKKGISPALFQISRQSKNNIFR